MYYSRFTIVIINHFMSKDQSIPRRNKVDWHMAKDDPILTTMRFIPKHETVQKYDAILPDTLTNQAMKESDAYKTYYDFATGKVIPKPKYVRPSTSEKTKQAPKVSPGKRLKATAKVAKSGNKKLPAKGLETLSEIAFSCANEGTDISPGVFDGPTYGSEDEQISWKSSDVDDDDEVSMSKDDDENSDNEDDDDQDDGNEQTESDNDGDDFVHLKFSTHDEEDKEEEWSDDKAYDEVTQDVPITNHDEIPPLFVTTLPPSPIPLIQPLQQTPVSTPTIVPSTSLQNLPTFGSLFKFEDRVKSLENNFSEFKQTNLFAEAVSLILDIVDKYLANQMNEAVKAAVQLQSDRLREEAQAKNQDFINKIDENMKKIIKEQVKVQVKEQVSKILPRIEKSVNEQLEAEVLIRSSNEAKTSHVVAANLSVLKLKKILIDKMENNKSIDRSVQQKTLYKALVDAYETDKDILATYGDASAEEQVHTIKDVEEPAHQKFEIGFTKDHPVDETTQLPDWFQKPAKPPTPNLDWNKTLPANHGPIKPWISTLA
ncbi:hypothetical protein Tco_0720321 [Tanacetum coccineum]